jgi:uncharacterized protein
MKIISEIYRSTKEDGMYLYVKKEEGLSRVPEDLMKLFGKSQAAMVLVLTPDRKLAHANVEKVIESLNEKGFYLQLPPKDQRNHEEMHMRNLNDKLA